MSEDPRTDQHPETGTPSKYPTSPGDAEPAPGGAGTGTEGAPENEPDAQPDSDKR